MWEGNTLSAAAAGRGAPGAWLHYQSLRVDHHGALCSDRLWFCKRFDPDTSAVGNAWFPLFRLTSLSSLSSSSIIYSCLFCSLSYFLFSSPLKFCCSGLWRNFEALPPCPQHFWGNKFLPSMVVGRRRLNLLTPGCSLQSPIPTQLQGDEPLWVCRAGTGEAHSSAPELAVEVTLFLALQHTLLCICWVNKSLL